MSSLHDNLARSILASVERYAADADMSPESVCRAATGNPRLYERLKRRAEYTETIASQLSKYMRENPASAKRHDISHGDDGANVQDGSAA